MHIIVDIRDAHPLSSLVEKYGESWAEIWKKNHPYDKISFLIFESQIAKNNEYIKVPHIHSSWWRRIGLKSHTGNQIFRCVNFSPYSPYDKRIPTLSHIFHNRSWLYPNEGENGFLSKKLIEYRMKRTIERSAKIIVPSMSTGIECVELWGVKEKNIEIIPYLPVKSPEEEKKIGPEIQMKESFFLYDGGFGSESNIISLLKGFEVYKHNLGGKYSLVIHGSPAGELSSLVQVIRTFDLSESVKLVGILEWEKYEELYRHAKGWIMLGSYYSSGPRIELAQSYHIPLILSDLPSIKGYNGIKIHPNHIIEELPQKLKFIEHKKITHKEHEYTVDDIMHAYEIYMTVSEKK